MILFLLRILECIYVSQEILAWELGEKQIPAWQVRMATRNPGAPDNGLVVQWERLVDGGGGDGVERIVCRYGVNSIFTEQVQQRYLVSNLPLLGSLSIPTSRIVFLILLLKNEIYIIPKERHDDKDILWQKTRVKWKTREQIETQGQ